MDVKTFFVCLFVCFLFNVHQKLEFVTWSFMYFLFDTASFASNLIAFRFPFSKYKINRNLKRSPKRCCVVWVSVQKENMYNKWIIRSKLVSSNNTIRVCFILYFLPRLWHLVIGVGVLMNYIKHCWNVFEITSRKSSYIYCRFIMI